jgi:cytochrome c peroxidase
MPQIRTIVSVIVLAGSTSIASAWEALPSIAPAPENNPTTAAKIELGRNLFHDPRLSSTGTISCASCHNTMAGGEDNRSNSMGVHGQTGGRSAPTVWNAAFNKVQFWDGRAPSLEAQAAGPVTNPIEMGMKSWDDVVVRLKAIEGYRTAFKKAFPDEAISKDTATKAIASYERILLTPNSPYDKFAKGDQSALTEQEKRGLNTMTEIGCLSCHSGAVFNGNGDFKEFPSIYNAYLEKQYQFSDDQGLYEVTKNQEDKHFFKIPTLRNIALTAPYFHNGSVKTLEKAVRIMATVQLGRKLSNTEVEDIVAFLYTLTGEFPTQALPTLPATLGKTFN